MSAAPQFSVVIPCHNYSRYLPQAVASATGQHGVTLEVIIVDDASTDDSAAVAERLGVEDPRVTLIRHAVNRGHIITYNDGLARAAGDYVVLLSADDLLTPGSLARSAALFEAHPEVGLVYGYAEMFQGDAVPPTVPTAARASSTWSGAAWVERMCRRGRNIIVNPEAVLRRSVLAEVGGYDPLQPQTADMELWLRAAAVSDVGRINGPVQALYRVHGANMHMTLHAGDLVELAARRLTFDVFFAGQGAGLAGADRLHRTALRALAREATRAAIRRTGAEDDSAAAFARFAAETWPAIVGTRSWRELDRRLRRPARPARVRAERFADRVRSSIQWRRWRRFGT